MAQIYAGWTLCPQSERGQVFDNAHTVAYTHCRLVSCVVCMRAQGIRSRL